MSNHPKKPGNEPDPDTSTPENDLPDPGQDAENIKEIGEPFEGNFA